jgi:hypothetical protein
VHCRTDDGKAFRTLNIIDEYSRECLAIRVDRKLNSSNVNDASSDLFILRGVPSFIRSDNSPEFVAQAVQDWIKAVGAKTAYIESGSPWENGFANGHSEHVWMAPAGHGLCADQACSRVAAMYTASEMWRIVATRPDECSRQVGCQSMARARMRSGPKRG